MDIEKLKRCLKCCADDNSKACNKCELEYGEEECQNLCGYAATALSALQIENQALRNAASGFKAENEKLREMYQKEKAVCHAVQAELEQVKRALAMMWFSHVNSDKEMPHSYETEALDEAERILGPWAECMPKYLRRGQKED